MSDIVEEAGGSLSTLYGMFGNKDGVFVASIESQLCYPNFEKYARNDPKGWLQLVGEELCRIIADHPRSAFTREVLRDAMRPCSSSKTAVREVRSTVIAQVAAKVASWMESGSIPPGDANLLATLFIGAIIDEVQFRTYVVNDPPDLIERAALIDGATRIVVSSG